MTSQFAGALAGTFNELDGTVKAVPPFQFVKSLHTVAPSFAERSPAGPGGMPGGLMQQDSEEFVSQLPCVLNCSTLKFSRRGLCS
jgi:hypothetical protein